MRKPPGRPRVTIEHFWTRIDKSGGEDACWICNWAIVQGYGQWHSKKAHRVAWELTNGPIPKGLLVLHDCPGGDNPACCNPRHLWLGTEQDNMTDKVEKGRHSFGHKHAEIMKRVVARGEQSARAKLTEDAVREIRASYRRVYGFGSHVLGRKYGVSANSIKQVILRKTWAHVV